MRLDGGDGDIGHTLLLEFLANLLLLVEVSLVGLKVVVTGLADAGVSGVGRVEVIHPVVVENVLAEVCESALSVRQFVNLFDATDVACVVAAWGVAGNLPFRLYEEDELLDDGLDDLQLVYAVDIFLVLVGHALLVEHAADEVALVVVVGMVGTLLRVAVAEVAQ